MFLKLLPLRFTFSVSGPLFFPPGKASNILRGALGHLLRASANVEGPGPIWLFEPKPPQTGPSGFSSSPRPFVFRAAHLGGRQVERGDQFYFDLNLFDLRDQVIIDLVNAFTRLSQSGLGAGRVPVRLLQVVQKSQTGGEPDLIIFDGASLIKRESLNPLRLAFDVREAAEVNRVCVHFLTPTELKDGGRIATRPEFSTLFSRIRDRVSRLRAYYGEGPLPIDFAAWGARASEIRIVQSDLVAVPLYRQSSRTGQTHTIGGSVGRVEYEGRVTEFLPFLRAARWTGVGRQTVWGKGEIKIEISHRDLLPSP